MLGANKKEVDFFNIVFSQELYRKIALETNLYAQQMQAANGNDPKWKDTTEEEIKAYIGLRLFMSIVDLPEMKMFWSKDAFFGNFAIANVMPRDRFNKLCQYFHVNDKTGYDRNDPRRDRLHLIRPIIDSVNRKCLKAYKPHKEVTVDEAMIAFRGRLSFRQYLPAKPTKYGIKVWVRADSNNGFVNEFQIYIGKPAGAQREVGLGKRVVLDLTEKIRDKRHHVFIDNYFNSVELIEELLSRNLYGCGTVRSNIKDLPEQMRPPTRKRRTERNNNRPAAPPLKLQPGQSKQWQKGNILATVWQEKKGRNPVKVLSANTDPQAPMSKVNRRQKDGTLKEVPCPEAVVQYNLHMNGVDHGDQMRTQYSTARTSKRWWTYIFWFLVDLCIANAFILMKESPNHQKRTHAGQPKHRSMLSFRKALAVQLIAKFRKNVRKRRVPTDPDVHGPAHWPKKRTVLRRCKNCAKNGVRHDSRFICSGCSNVEQNKFVHLCVTCFQEYHESK